MSATTDRSRLFGVASLVGASLGLLIVAGSGAWRRERIVDTQALVLRDEAGRIRAHLFTEPDGTTKLALLDSDGRDRVALKACPGDDAALELYDQGRLRVSVVSDTLGQAAVRVFDRRNQGRASLYVSTDNTAGLELVSKEQRVDVATQSQVFGGMLVSAADGRAVHGVGVRVDGVKVVQGAGGTPLFLPSEVEMDGEYDPLANTLPPLPVPSARASSLPTAASPVSID
jgi:hypothetical protein